MTEISISQEPGLGEVTIIRTYNAPRELVFSCFVEPERLAQFWGPKGTHVPLESVVIEPRVGGRFEALMVADDGSGEFPMTGVFVEFEPPEVFSFAEPGYSDQSMVSRSTFEDLGDGRTRVTIYQTNVPEQFRSAEAMAGMTSSLDRFEEYLASL